MKEECNLVFYIKAINNIMDKKLNEKLNSLGITRTQADIMLYIMLKIKKNEIVTQRDIEKQFSISNPTVVGILKRLEDKNYIKKEKYDNDIRYNKIILTDKFYNIVKQVKTQTEKAKKEVFKNFTKEEKDTLLKLLKKVYQNI